MTLVDFLVLGAIPVYAAVAGMLALAAWLIQLDPRAAPHRAFALVLFLWSVVILTQTFSDLANQQPGLISRGSAHGLQAVATLSLLWMLPALAWFLSVYPRARGPLATHWGQLALVAASLTLAGAFLLEPSLVAGWMISPDGVLLGNSGVGPLNIVLNASVAGIGIVGWVLARDHARAGEGSQQRSLFLVALGFVLYPLYRCSTSLMGWLDQGLPLLDPELPTPDAAYAFVGHPGLYLVVLLAVVIAAWMLYRDAGTDPAHTRGTRRMLVILYAASLVLAAVRVWGSPPRFVTLGLVNLSFPLLATYALVRHQLFDIDLKVNWTVKQSTVAASFVAVFFIVSEGAQELFAGTVGPLLGILAAGALVFALAPLQRVAQQVADAAVPTDARRAAALRGSPEETYRELARQAWQDGAVDRSERAMLDRARQSLGLELELATRIEREASDERP